MPTLQLRLPMDDRLSVWPARIAFSDVKPSAVAALQNAGAMTGKKLRESGHQVSERARGPATSV